MPLFRCDRFDIYGIRNFLEPSADLPRSKSGKPTASATCESASPGSRRLPRDANQQVREAGDFRDMRTSKSGKPAASATCESASPGSRRLPRHANQQVREADDFREMLISKSGKLTTSARC